MKKSILFGALAFFAISALGVTNATAQNADSKSDKTKTTTISVKEDVASSTTIAQEPVKKKDDCCADKKGCDKKCKDGKKVIKKSKGTKVDNDVMKPSVKNDTKNKKEKKESSADK